MPERPPSESTIKSREAIVDAFSEKRQGRLLDIPAGAGHESRALGALGHGVCSVDLLAHSRADGLMGAVCADANFTLPFHDRAFDYVLSREGIEHLENQSSFALSARGCSNPGARSS